MKDSEALTLLKKMNNQGLLTPIIDHLVQHGVLSTLEYPLDSYDFVVKNWNEECSDYLYQEGYKNGSTHGSRVIVDDDPTIYALHDVETPFQEVRTYVERVYQSIK